MSARLRRQELISALIAEHPVGSQEQLAALLESQGVRATQATLSRDLRELGAYKTPGGYALARDRGSAGPEPTGGDFRDRVLGSFVLSVAQGGQMVVVKTGPGRAQLVAVELDDRPPAGVLGTVAGDDTIFLACDGPASALRVADELRGVIGLVPELSNSAGSGA